MSRSAITRAYDRFGRVVGEFDTRCPKATNGMHYKLMTDVLSAYAKPSGITCDHCGQALYISGALWATYTAVEPGPTIVIQEEPSIEEMLSC